MMVVGVSKEVVGVPKRRLMETRWIDSPEHGDWLLLERICPVVNNDYQSLK